jgi:hypothetical protein
MIMLLATAMAGAAPAKAPEYDVTIDPVHEVCLLGQADLSYWESILAKEDLFPSVVDGHAEVMICALRSRFKGVRFSEGVVSVFTSREKGGSSRDGAFLARAFNSLSFFAWVERTLYKAPYHRAEIAVTSQGIQSSARIDERGEMVLEARMAGHPAPVEPVQNVWEGPIYLPRAMVREKDPARYFFVRLEGLTQIYPFLPGQDSLSLGMARPEGIAGALRDSHFEARAWWIREAGRHSKSKSLKREGR